MVVTKIYGKSGKLFICIYGDDVEDFKTFVFFLEFYAQYM